MDEINNNYNKKFELSDRFFMLLGVLVLGVLVFFVGQMAYQFTALDRQNTNQISVSGEGKVYAKPDVALASFGVTNQGTAVADVTKVNTEKMNAVIAAIKALSVDEKDIQTTNFNLSPIYNYGSLSMMSSYPTRSSGTITGYTLTQNVQIKIRDFTKIGDIFSKVTASGANLASDLQFTIDNPEQYKQEARAKAIAQAKENAKNLVDASGIKLGKLVNVYENYYPTMYSSKAVGMGGGSAVDAVPVPVIQPGQQEIAITINLTYQVR